MSKRGELLSMEDDMGGLIWNRIAQLRLYDTARDELGLATEP